MTRNNNYAKVWHGTLKKTSGGLTKKDLMKNKWGRIVSKKRHNLAKKNKFLIKAGYVTQKGKFGAVKIADLKKSKSKSKKSKGSKRR